MKNTTYDVHKQQKKKQKQKQKQKQQRQLQQNKTANKQQANEEVRWLQQDCYSNPPG